MGETLQVESVLDRLQSMGCRPGRNGAGWRSLCPAHDDHQPSLSISSGDDGRALLKCFAGCTFEAIVARLGLKAGGQRQTDTLGPKELDSRSCPRAGGDAGNGNNRCTSPGPDAGVRVVEMLWR